MIVSRFQWNNSTELDLSYRNLKRLPWYFSKTSKLKNLNISGNKIKRFPRIILNLPQLEYLDINFNPLRKIPKKISKLQSLRSLSLRSLDSNSNRVKKLPSGFGELSNMEVLDLRNNFFGKGCPLEICKLYRLKKLYLGLCCLEYLPAEFYDLRHLEVLDLSSNYLKTISPDIKNFTQLQHLDLSCWHLVKNQISELPLEIFTLQNLRYLDLGDNPLKQISPLLGNLTNLEYLSLNGTTCKIPLQSIKRLKKLQDLALNEEYLSQELVELISELPSLKTLDSPFQREDEYRQAQQMFPHLTIYC